MFTQGPRRQEREYWAEAIFKEIIVENVPVVTCQLIQDT